MKFTAQGRQYKIHKGIGHVTQEDAKPYVYDAAYSATYDTPDYMRASAKLMALRLGFVLGVHGHTPASLLDMGYGAGQFMAAAKEAIPNVYGHDLTGVPVPEGCIKMDTFDPGTMVQLEWDGTPGALKDGKVITFWDCLEHIPTGDLSLILLRAHKERCTICVSLPNCEIDEKGLDWFANEYPHLKPDEHLRHFNEASLERFMKGYVYRATATSYHEDIVRKRYPRNILTMAFKPV